MSHVLRRSLVALLLCSPQLLHAESYITDSVTVGVFPSIDLVGEPVVRLKSGAPVKVLESQGDLRLIKSEHGEKGWMRASFIMSTAPAVHLLAQAKSDIAQLEADLEVAQGKHSDLAAKEEKANKAVKWMRAEMNKARNESKELEAKLEKVKSEDSEADALAVKVGDDVNQLKSEKADLEKRLAATLMIDDASRIAEGRVEESIQGPSLLWPMATLLLGGLLGGAISYAWLDRRLRQRFGGIRFH
ncbi:hypothetical protein ACFL2V_11050 [Pseudomonadota bacterium]